MNDVRSSSTTGTSGPLTPSSTAGNIFQFGPSIAHSGLSSPSTGSSSSLTPYAFSPSHYLSSGHLSSFHHHMHHPHQLLAAGGYNNSPGSPFLVPTSPVVSSNARSNFYGHTSSPSPYHHVDAVAAFAQHQQQQQAMMSAAASLVQNQSLRAMASSSALTHALPSSGASTHALPSSSSSSSSSSSVSSSTRNSPTASTPPDQQHDLNNNSSSPYHSNNNNNNGHCINNKNTDIHMSDTHGNNNNNHTSHKNQRNSNNQSNGTAGQQNNGTSERQAYTHCYTRGSMIQLADGTIRRVEDIKTEDFLACDKTSSELTVEGSTVVRIESRLKSQAEDRGQETVFLTLAVGRRKDTFTVETPVDHPFFVYYKGWSSCSPDRSRLKYGLDCRRLQEGDNCISLSRTSAPKLMANS